MEADSQPGFSEPDYVLVLRSSTKIVVKTHPLLYTVDSSVVDPEPRLYHLLEPEPKLQIAAPAHFYLSQASIQIITDNQNSEMFQYDDGIICNFSLEATCTFLTPPTPPQLFLKTRRCIT
jgi:hypothetical protein